MALLSIQSAFAQALFVQIDFQGGFYQDTVSLYMGNKLLLDKKIITTDEILGVASSVRLVKYKNHLKVFEGKKKSALMSLSSCTQGLTNIELIINGKCYSQALDLSCGNYIGISCGVEHSKIEIIYSPKPFGYF